MVLYEKVFDAEKILRHLREIDKVCTEKRLSANILIVGGSAFSLFMRSQGQTFRKTMDIDIGNAPFESHPSMTPILNNLGLEIVGGVLFPDVNEIEVHLILYEGGFKTIKVYIPTPEMMVCIKALTNRLKDYLDIIESGILEFCDIKQTIALIEEYKDYLLFVDPLYYHVDEVLEVLKTKL